MLELHGVHNDSEQAVTCRALVWQQCSLCVQLYCVRVRVKTRPSSCRRRCPLAEHGSRAASSAAPSPKTSSHCRGMAVHPLSRRSNSAGWGRVRGTPSVGGPPLPNCLVSLCVAMIAITLLATQGHGFRCVSSLHQVSLAFGQPRVASPSRAQPPQLQPVSVRFERPGWPCGYQPQRAYPLSLQLPRTAAACPALGAFSSGTVAGRACVQAEAPRGLPYWHVPAIHNVPIVSVLAEAPRGLPY